jgi:serine/threonine-protein kinase
MTGRTIDGRYRVGRLIGQGAMGMVYEGEHAQLGRKLAIKLIKPQAMATEVSLQRFRNEARIAGSVGHRNIRGIVDMGTTDDGIAYIVMHYLKGLSLGEVLREKGALPVRDAVEVAIQVLEALRAVHAKGIVHRDIKPDNIFLAEEMGGGVTVKVLDFGLSRLSRPLDGRKFELTKPGAVMGTPRYMSPEQAQCSKGVDLRTDVFSVGVLLYRMVTGRKRFEQWDHESYVSSQNPASPPRPVAFSSHRKLPEALGGIIMKAMAWDPEARFQDADEFIEALAPFRFASLLGEGRPGDERDVRDSAVEVGELARRVQEVERERRERRRDQGGGVLATPWLLATVIAGLAATLGLAAFVAVKMSALDRKMSALESKADDALPATAGERFEVEVVGAPPGAEVYVDGELHPERPVVVDGSPGEHVIEVRATGYRPFARTVDPSQSTELKVEMEPR